MTTQFPITEPQAALLAACPRPRAVAPSASMPLMPSSSPAWVGVVRLGAVAEERNGGFAASSTRRGFGYAVAGIVGNGSTSTRQDQQHKQHLTARRGPVTWRPPH
jgi:hypothetical protein